MARKAKGSTQDATTAKAASQERFLEAYAKIATITGACAATQIGRRTHYHWMRDAAYKARWHEADTEATERLEQEARRRAMVGTEKPVFYKGQVCGHIREYSDVLLIFLLKGRKPEVYRERYEHTGPDGGPIETVQRVIVDGANADN